MSKKQKFNLVIPRDGSDGNTYWTYIGVAFPINNGYSLTFNALPIPNENGEVRVLMFEDNREKRDHRRENKGQRYLDEAKRQSGQDDIDDDIPF